MKNLSLRQFAASLLMCVLLSSGLLAKAQTVEDDKPLRVKIEVTFLSADKDVNLNYGWAITTESYDKLTAYYTSGKSPKLHVWSVQSKELNAGESFDLSMPSADDGVETVSIATSKYGVGRPTVGLAVSALKQRVEEPGQHPYTVINNWGLATDFTLPVGAVTILGGGDGDPLMGKRAKKRLPPQNLYVAVAVRPAT